MLVIVDVQYSDPTDTAGIGAIVAADWHAANGISERSNIHKGLDKYVPGQFYKRELPCILPTLKHLMSEIDVQTIVIDGYIDVKPGHPGLGRHLFQALDEKVSVIGVAKNAFTDTHASPVLRGQSLRPLWVTSTGDQVEAATKISTMHGDARIPTLLHQADRLARKAVCKR